MSRPTWLKDWLGNVLEDSKLQVKDIDLLESQEWSLRDGAIRHHSNKFFNIVGAKSEIDGQEINQPLIEQREIGLLGFIVNDKNKILVQAKVEPGNVGIVQLAPSCQATASNAARAHGGSTPPLVDMFNSQKLEILSSTLQSEQGTRFLDKLNRNVLARTSQDIPESTMHRWITVDELLSLVTVDYLINTDARSVLISSPWEQLVGRIPFSRNQDKFSRELMESAVTKVPNNVTRKVTSKITLARQIRKPTTIIPLDNLVGWKLTKTGVSPSAKTPFKVKQIKVVVNGREVPSWDQPIAHSSGVGVVDLWCGRFEGKMVFIFSTQNEIGLHNRIELGPTVFVSPGELINKQGLNLPKKFKVLASCRQSDEGGRFFQDTSVYRLIDVGELGSIPEGFYQLTLNQINNLLLGGGWFSNEARSVLSLILKWL